MIVDLLNFRYNALSRPSDGMADVAVSKTVVERRASSTLASGTTRNEKGSGDPEPFAFAVIVCATYGAPHTALSICGTLFSKKRLPIDASRERTLFRR